MSVANTPAEARVFIEQYGWTWPSIVDRERLLARRLGAEYQPHLIVVDAEGKIVDSWEGLGNDEIWETLADRVS